MHLTQIVARVYSQSIPKNLSSLPSFSSGFMSPSDLRIEILRANTGTKREREVDDEIEVGDRTIFFQDPITLERITHPGRFEGCEHLQCFDLSTLIEYQMNENLSGFDCSVCYVKGEASALRVDGAFLGLLEKYRGAGGCIVAADGTDRELGNVAVGVEDDDVVVVGSSPVREVIVID
jgi:hypothetical protein